MVLTDGAHHPVDSSDWAFYQCAQFAMGDCSTDGVWQVLEPVMKVECTGPEEFQVNSLTKDIFHSDHQLWHIIDCQFNQAIIFLQGACVSALSKRSGLITDVDSDETGWFTAECEAPLNKMFGISAELRSLTQVSIELLYTSMYLLPLNCGIIQM